MTEPKPPSGRPAAPLTEQRIDFAYTVYWTKTAQTWEAGRRQAIAARVAALVESSEFLNNAFERRYRVDGLDDLSHSGASLLALKKVLEALE